MTKAAPTMEGTHWSWKYDSGWYTNTLYIDSLYNLKAA